MKIIAKSKDQYTLRFDYGENFLAELKRFLIKNKLEGGWVLGLGAMVDPEIAYYDFKMEKYLKKKIKGKFEVLNLTGNAAWLKKEPVLHIHIILGKKNFTVLGGHLVDGKAGGTLEITLNAGQKLKRARDKSTGLNFLIK